MGEYLNAYEYIKTVPINKYLNNWHNVSVKLLECAQLFYLNKNLDNWSFHEKNILGLPDIYMYIILDLNRSMLVLQYNSTTMVPIISRFDSCDRPIDSISVS